MKAYFFDLDGTLADSREGLFSSFRAALKALGIGDLSDEELDRFLGSPLPEMFRVLRPDISKADIVAGMDAFRAAYEARGIMQNRLYDGVAAMLEAIVRRGAVTWVVTSKPQQYAVRVTQDLKIDRQVQGVIGAGLDETDTKGELIARALLAAKVPAAEAVMLGDRYYDIVGAFENKVMAVGALWGYGSYEELHSAGCRAFVTTPAEFRAQFVDVDAARRAMHAPAGGV
jgi:phosphoglycolate phosphatase